MKVQLSINDKLMERADEYADKNYMQRSDLVTLALTEYLNAKEIQAIMPELVVCMRSIADNEKIITVEDTLELHLDRIFPHRDIVAMKTNNIASYTDGIKSVKVGVL